MGRNFRKELLEDTVTLRPKLVWEPPESLRGCDLVRGICVCVGGLNGRGTTSVCKQQGKPCVLAKGRGRQRETGQERWGQMGGSRMFQNVLYGVQMSDNQFWRVWGRDLSFFFFLPGLFLLWVEISLVADRAGES